MHNESSCPWQEYLNSEQLVQAMKAGPLQEENFYEAALQQALANDDAAGIYTVLLSYIPFYSRINDRVSALRLAERFANLDLTNAMICRYVAQTVYDIVQDASLALKYLDRGLSHLLNNSQITGPLSLATKYKEVNHAMQLKLFILADSFAEPDVVRDCLSQLTLLMNATLVAGPDLRNALYVLSARDLLTTDHKILIEREVADLKIWKTSGLDWRGESEALVSILDNLPDLPDVDSHDGET